MILKLRKICHPLAHSAGLFLVLSIPSRTPVARSESGEGTAQTRFNVGYQVLDLKYQKNGHEQALTVAVWYPTEAQPKSHHYGGPTSGQVAVDATPRAGGGPFPFLVFSHGYGGSGLGAVFFTEALAARGWIVACPDHHDKHSAVRIRTGASDNFDRRGLLQHGREIASSGPGDRGKYLYRLDEMKLALDGMLTSVPFGKLIDRDRIAVGGHSLGAFTALGLCGTIPERLDPRPRAVLLFSPGAGGYLFEEEELEGVRIPSLLFMGERERGQLRGSHTMAELSEKIFRNVSSPKRFLEVRGANHFSFNSCLANHLGKMPPSGTEEQFEVIRRYSIAFLESYVAGRAGLDNALGREDAKLTRCLGDPLPAVSGSRPPAKQGAPADAAPPRR